MFAAGLACFAAVAAFFYSLERAPLPAAAPLPQTTFVYDDSGHVLAVFSEQDRVDVTLKQVPRVVIDAVVSTEDRHFFTEGALNPVSIVRAFLADVRGSGSLQGASTITQQYVKQTYLSSQRTLTRKLKEAALAIRVSRAESKDEILQNYLNTIYWGRGAYGIGAAAEAYFGKDVGALGLAEASLLAGLIREPETADPARNPALARTNQDDTLRDMVRDKKITAAQAAAVEATPFSRYVVAPSASAGPASGIPGAAYFVDAVRSELVARYGRQMVDGGGLRVTTTLDPTLQRDAYDTVYGKGASALDPAKGEPSGALVSVDDTGAVRALVGGQSYRRSSVDLALGRAGGGSGRQAGSTFKAFMLAEVIKEGYSILSAFPAPPEVVLPHGNANGTPWRVINFEHETVAPTMNLIDATALSVNTVYAQVVARIGAARLDAMAEAMGIAPQELAGAYPSQVLGTADVSPLEMAGAYATLADGGVHHAPILISRVTTAAGTPLPLPVPATSRRVLSTTQAAEETYALEQVVQRGTGVVAGGLPSPVAGKTGTTEHSSDAWFIGYTPRLTTAVWMGYASSDRPMVDFRGLSSVQGGSIPAELWHAYMDAALSDEPQYEGTFPAVSLVGRTLTPPPASSLEFPLGMGTTTTSSTSTTSTTPTTSTTSTTVPAAGVRSGGGATTTLPAGGGGGATTTTAPGGGSTTTSTASSTTTTVKPTG